MEIIEITEITLHELTNTHPVMTDKQFNAFKADIRNNGQLVPVLVYRGKIVDGRHRYRALLEIGISTIKINRLSNNMTITEVKEIINSTETRRHQTPTQLAIKAYKLYTGGMKRAKAVNSTGCSNTNLKYVINIINLGREDIINLLTDGYKYNVSNDARFVKMTDSLSAIVRKVKLEVEQAKEKSEEYSDDEDEENKHHVERLTKEELDSLNAVSLLVTSWSEGMQKKLISKLYDNIALKSIDN